MGNQQSTSIFHDLVHEDLCANKKKRVPSVEIVTSDQRDRKDADFQATPRGTHTARQIQPLKLPEDIERRNSPVIPLQGPWLSWFEEQNTECDRIPSGSSNATRTSSADTVPEVEGNTFSRTPSGASNADSRVSGVLAALSPLSARNLENKRSSAETRSQSSGSNGAADNQEHMVVRNPELPLPRSRRADRSSSASNLERFNSKSEGTALRALLGLEQGYNKPKDNPRESFSRTSSSESFKRASTSDSARFTSSDFQRSGSSDFQRSGSNGKSSPTAVKPATRREPAASPPLSKESQQRSKTKMQAMLSELKRARSASGKTTRASKVDPQCYLPEEEHHVSEECRVVHKAKAHALVSHGGLQHVQAKITRAGSIKHV